MNRNVPFTLAVLLAAAAYPPSSAEARELSFDQRVNAQEAIERVYYSHQDGATEPFERAVPRTILERKVRTYLAQSLVLETWWRTPVTDAMLERETERMARDSRMPGRLRELFTALGNDGFLIEETLARQVLVDRLTHEFFASDERAHAGARSFDDWLNSVAPDVNGRFASVSASAGATLPVIGGGATTLTQGFCDEDDTWTALPTSPLHGRIGHTAVWTGSRMIIWGGQSNEGVQYNSGARYDPATDAWSPTSTTAAPLERAGHTAVWSGSRMIVWGGRHSSTDVDTGGRYDPIGDSWQPTSTANAPLARIDHTAVWTGSRMIVWGGYNYNHGGRYDPVMDTWSPTSTVDAPYGRYFHTAIWTGSRMVVWGGVPESLIGGRYDPDTDTWTSMSSSGAPGRRYEHSAVWTGSDMIVWGGRDVNFSTFPPTQITYNDGSRYDPLANAWTPISVIGTPAQSYTHEAVWTGREMIVWRGPGNSSGRYDPESNSWVPLSSAGSPAARQGHTAVWTGSFMIVWGGIDLESDLADGGRYALGHALDDDGDGASECSGDCNDDDPTYFDVPHEIQNLRWLDSLTLGWNSDAPHSGSATTYDVMYGDLKYVDIFGSGVPTACMHDGVQATQAADASPALNTGAGRYYLVRGDNGCGAGRWETASNGSDRPADVCP